jgi:hypothetical protein
LAGSPAIAIEVVRLLREAGLETPPNETFNPNRAPIITPKAGEILLWCVIIIYWHLRKLIYSMSLSNSLGMKGLKMGPVGKNDSDGTDAQEDKMASNVICKCEKVTGTSNF